jgi:hypothetical protein
VHVFCGKAVDCSPCIAVDICHAAATGAEACTLPNDVPCRCNGWGIAVVACIPYVHHWSCGCKLGVPCVGGCFMCTT